MFFFLLILISKLLSSYNGTHVLCYNFNFFATQSYIHDIFDSVELVTSTLLIVHCHIHVSPNVVYGNRNAIRFYRYCRKEKYFTGPICHKGLDF